MGESLNQQWLDFLADIAYEGCTKQQYFDLGQEIIVSAMLGGSAWMPLSRKKSNKVSFRHTLTEVEKKHVQTLSEEYFINDDVDRFPVTPRGPMHAVFVTVFLMALGAAMAIAAMQAIAWTINKGF